MEKEELFREYIKRYASESGIDEKEAMKHKIVWCVGRYYGLSDEEIQGIYDEP